MAGGGGTDGPLGGEEQGAVHCGSSQDHLLLYRQETRSGLGRPRGRVPRVRRPPDQLRVPGPRDGARLLPAGLSPLPLVCAKPGALQQPGN